jgi:hypothetical protein
MIDKSIIEPFSGLRKGNICTAREASSPAIMRGRMVGRFAKDV